MLGRLGARLEHPWRCVEQDKRAVRMGDDVVLGFAETF